MASEMEKWARRKCYPVPLLDGETGYVSKMDFGQLDDSYKVDASDKTAFVVACCMCTESGIPVIPPRGDDEELNDFVARAKKEIRRFSTDNTKAFVEAVTKVTTPNDHGENVKN